ncbi:hypothetical protein N2152v2_005571 [Parachlorella kessleri]
MKATLSVALLCLLAGVVSCRELQATTAPPSLQLPASCNAKYTCTGSGDQLYNCNGTRWVGTGSDVKLTCGSESGTYTYVSGTPTYKLGCGSVEGNAATQLRVTNPSNNPEDSTLYRRDATAGSGCLSDIKYIARTEAKGGLPKDYSCPKSGDTARIPYSGSWEFLAC